jgi:ribonucleoside-diphosphate reductase alpha chain
MTSKKNKDSFRHMRAEILRRRYLWKDKNGKVVETEDQMFRRVAQYVASAEFKYGTSEADVKKWADVFNDLMKDNEFLPNSPTLMNAGRKNGMLSACFTLPIEDSIDGIFDSVKYAALIQKAGGGTGFSFDRLRPTGDIVESSGGKTSGPVSFMKVFSEGTSAIQQGAFRRGANMGMMSIEHPDILNFIHAKSNPTAFTNFNLSVKVSDAFMQQLDNNPDALHIVINPRTKDRYVIPFDIDLKSYTIDDLLPEKDANWACLTVKEIWDKIVAQAYQTGEPGIFFVDKANQENPTPHVGEIESTNPCGEQPMLPYEACNLGSINVSAFVSKDGTELDWARLGETVTAAVRFLDNVIDVNHYPIPEVEKITLSNRKIGLGIMGFADALILLGIRYGNAETVEFAEMLASFIQEHAHDASEELAKKRGYFPNWQGSIWNTKHNRRMRNAALTTIAPTGTISLIAGCSSGIEPIFCAASKRRVLNGEEFVQLHPLIERIGTEEGWLTEKISDQLGKGIPSREIPGIPRRFAHVFTTAHEVNLERHVKIQAIFQKYVDNAVSKTVNLPANATVGDVDKVYKLAHKLDCKGITVYRDGSRENQVIVAAHQILPPDVGYPTPRQRPKTIVGGTTKAKTGCGSLFITINEDDTGLFEIFTNLGRAGGCPSQSEATARILSVALRCGVDPKILVEQLKGIRCLSTIARRKEDKNIDVLSCPDAIARAIEEVLGEVCAPVKISVVNRCPDCNQPLRRESGCNVCDVCGYSKCG